MNKELSGYPSVDKPWMKYYPEESFMEPLPQCSMYEYMMQSNKDYLKQTAITYLGMKMSYVALFDKIDQAARAFSYMGVKSGDIVTVALPNIPQNIICMYALNRIGAIANMIDLRIKGSALISALNEGNSKLAVICDIFANQTFSIASKTALERIVVTSPFDSLPAAVAMVFKSLKKKQVKFQPKVAVYSWSAFLKQGKSTVIPTALSNVVAKDTACIVHTSGTTGSPKGVMLTNLCFNAMTLQYRHCGVFFQRGDTFLNQVPPFLAYNLIMATHVPLVLGMSVILLPEYAPHKFAENITKLKPNHVAAGPADWGNFLEHTDLVKGDYSFLKTMGSGSESMKIKQKIAVNELLQAHHCTSSIIEGYGMTEVGSSACTNVPQCNVLGSVGIPLPLTTFCIYDSENDCEVEYGESGEICITGPTLMNGYYQRPDETNAVLKQHQDGLRWMHTGDLGMITKDGLVFLQGRMKRVIIRYDGQKVSPYDIETVLLQHPDVINCCIVGKPDAVHGSGALPFAVIESYRENAAFISELNKLCQAELSEKNLPIGFEIMEKLPLTPNGKVDYRTLEKQQVEKCTS